MSTTVPDAGVAPQAVGIGVNGGSLPILLRDYEKRLIVEALVASKGSQRRAARALGVSPTTLSMKMLRLGLRGEPEGSAAARA